jgi:hypothetical protein
MRSTTFATALAIVAIPTIASAHGGNTDPNMVHVCIGNISKVARIVGVSGACLSSPSWAAETPMHWPRVEGTGPQGPTGDKGDQGIQGIQGVQGNPGTNGTNGIDGANGTNGADGTGVTFVGYVLPGDANCPNGGAIFATGAVNAYVCNGQNAATGATRPAPPCFDSFPFAGFNHNRYVDCGNGTVTDTVTGLIWLKWAKCLPTAAPRVRYGAANAAAAALKDGDCGLSDGSSPGDWRLPTKDEWSATLAHGIALGCSFPALTNDAGTACLSVGPSSFVPQQFGSGFWSSSANELSPDEVWFVNLLDGHASFANKSSALEGVWAVRGGPR